jgi:glutathione peroxidase
VKHLPPLTLIALVPLLAIGALACQKTPDTAAPAPADTTSTTSAQAAATGDAASLHALTAKRLDGTLEPLSTYKGKVALVVNTASECGYTPQYAGLQKLYEELSPKGFVVLGFPSNDFGGQEPGSSKEIATFCSTKFKVTFPLFEKVVTKGPSPSPVYAFLAKGFGRPEWNFHKYVVGKDGLVKKAFPSKVTPESDELRKAIDEALAAPAP